MRDVWKSLSHELIANLYKAIQKSLFSVIDAKSAVTKVFNFIEEQSNAMFTFCTV